VLCRSSSTTGRDVLADTGPGKRVAVVGAGALALLAATGPGFVLRPSSDARIVIGWRPIRGTPTTLGGPNLYAGGTHVTTKRRCRRTSFINRPGKGRRVTGTGAP
jgi:hypothetical protein